MFLRNRRLFLLLLLCSCTVAFGQRQGRRQTSPSPMQEFALGATNSGPAIVSIDEDDNIWVALAKTGQLVRYSNGELRTFELGGDSRPVGVAAGRASNGQAGIVWIAASYDNKLIRFDSHSGDRKEFAIAGEASWPFNIAIGPSGQVWFTERAAGRVGRLDPQTGE